MAGVAVGLQDWASQETNIWKKTIGLFERCTDRKSGGSTCESISSIHCDSNADPSGCDASACLRCVRACSVVWFCTNDSLLGGCDSYVRCYWRLFGL